MELILKLQKSYEPEIEGLTKIFTDNGGTIGRLPTCVWQLKDISCSLSREHARIYTQDGLFYLEDKSTNGVFINDSILALGPGNFYLLNVDDKVSMGDYVFKVESIQTDDFIPVDESIPQLDIQLNPIKAEVHQPDLSSDSQDVLAGMFAEDDSILKTDIEHSEALFSASDTDDIIAKNSDEFMAELTGDGSDNELHLNQQYVSQGIDTHDVEMGSAFNIPETIPENIDFMKQNSSVEVNAKIPNPLEGENNIGLIKNQSIKSDYNHQIESNTEGTETGTEDPLAELSGAEQTRIKINESALLMDIKQSGSDSMQEKSESSRNDIDLTINKIPAGFIPDISFTEDKNNVLTTEHAETVIDKPISNTLQDGSEQQLIPDDYVPGVVDISESMASEKNIKNSSIGISPADSIDLKNSKDINYKNAINELFITQGLNIEQYDPQSFNSLMKKMADIIKQYTMTHNIDLTPDTVTDLTIDKDKG